MNTSPKWYVVTGVPSSGKTTVLDLLQKAGLRIVPEAARTLIDEELARGRTIQELRADELVFQRRVLEMKRRIEGELPRAEVIFFDRGMPDSAAYYRFIGADPSEALASCERGLYQKVFLMEPLPFIQDHARTEDPATLARLHALLREAYEELGYEVVLVPVMTPEERMRFVLERM